MAVDSPRTLITGIFAHVDAGKTTLTEQLLYLTGAVRSPGRVDSGSAHTDFLDLERRRGISVRTASVSIEWHGARIGIIDTPGHSDFSAETARAVRATDLAVVVLSAADGVQSQTEAIWAALEKSERPALFFINKTDLAGADINSCLKDIAELTGAAPRIFDPGSSSSLCENFAEYDDSALEKYIEKGEDAFSPEELSALLKKTVYSRAAVPVLTGSALRGEGVKELLDALSMLAVKGNDGGRPAGVVFKVGHSASFGRAAYLRLFSGALKNRDTVLNAETGAEEKITQIREVMGARERDTGVLRAGEIGAVYGLTHTKSGDVIGDVSSVPPAAEIASPALRVKITPLDAQQYPALSAALAELCAEDPLLDVIWEKEQREMLVRVSGLVHIEILQTVLEERYGLGVNIGKPVVIYRERPLKRARGCVEYTMPKPCWAVMEFEIEPLPVGSGYVFESRVPDDRIFMRYQAQVRQTLPEALSQGPKGWEVTDLKIVLTGGEHHIVHTHPLDFVLATPMGIMDALVNSGTELLEPIQKFRMTFPEEASGKVIGEIISLRGQFETPAVKKGVFTMEGTLPLATSMDLPMRISQITGGRGTYSSIPAGYAPCPPGEGHTVPYRGVSPLDHAKYILYKRGALGA